MQILGSLSSDLAISVLQATNATLPTLFASLPGALHPLALRTHIPSIDCNHQLCIEHQDMSALSHTMVLAASHLPSLTNLSFHQRHLLPESLDAVFSAIGNLTNLQVCYSKMLTTISWPWRLCATSHQLSTQLGPGFLAGMSSPFWKCCPVPRIKQPTNLLEILTCPLIRLTDQLTGVERVGDADGPGGCQRTGCAAEVPAYPPDA